MPLSSNLATLPVSDPFYVGSLQLCTKNGIKSSAIYVSFSLLAPKFLSLYMALVKEMGFPGIMYFEMLVQYSQANMLKYVKSS